MKNNPTIIDIRPGHLSSRALLLVGLIVIFLSGGPVIAAKARSGESPVPQQACDATVRIMPLGDSITRGSSGEIPNDQPGWQVGFRKYLYDSLIGAGYQVEFVGSETNGENHIGFDANHEGHGGINAAGVATNIYNNEGGENWITLNPPDIILLHIGTNSLSTSTTNVANILNEIDEYESDSGETVTVILARIINRIPYSQDTTTFNINLETMAQTRVANGDNILLPLVDMEYGAGIIYEVQPDGDMYYNGSNTLHPFHTGYEKMANVWKRGIDTLFQHCNQWPEITTDPGAPSHAENETVNLDFNASDPEGQAEGSGLTYSAANLPPGLTIDVETGIISGTVDYEAFNGQPYDVTVTVTDSGQPKMSDEVGFTWAIQNTNRPPDLTNPGNQTGAENSPVNLQLQASDPDEGDGLTYSAQGLPPGLGISPSSGLISGTITFEAAANSPYTVTVKATDSGALDDPETFQWFVDEANRRPNLSQPGPQTGVEGNSDSLQLQATDLDGDTLTYTAEGLPADLEINPATGLISGVLSCTAAANSPYNVTATATDDGIPVLQDTKSFTWSVTTANCAPVVNRPNDQTDAEGDTISLQVTASDPDGDGGLTFDGQGLPSGLSIDQDGHIAGVLGYGANAGSPYTVTVSATDPGGRQGSASFQWNVQNTNRPPALQAIPNQNDNEGDTVSLQVQANDPDQDPLQYSLQGQPAGLFIDADSGLIQGKIACETAGSYTATVTVTDGALSDSEAFTWQVFQAECIPPDEFAFIPILLKP